MKRKLVLSNGNEYIGSGFASESEVIGELVFNTSVVGYQEELSDPTYLDLMLCMTYPLIGNYGITDDDYESRIISPKALIVREYNDKPSNFRYTKTLNELLEENDVVGLTHVDTRSITKVLRDNGSMIGIICDENISTEDALDKIDKYVECKEKVSRVSCKKLWYSRCSNPKYNVVIIDCGIKYSIIKNLNKLGCNVTIVPFNTSVVKIESLSCDGIIISNGPGSPYDVKEVIENIKLLQGKYPLFGIGLGYQLIGIANDMEAYKLKVGHRGSNHPVKDNQGKIINVSENHGYAIKPLDNIQVIYRDIMDKTIEGISVLENCFGVQFDPNEKIYKGFIELMDKFKGEKNNG